MGSRNSRAEDKFSNYSTVKSAEMSSSLERKKTSGTGGAAGAGGTEQTGGGPGRLSHAGKGQHSNQSSTMQQARARSHLSPSSYQHQQIPTAASVENLLALSPTRSGTGQQALWAQADAWPTEQSQQVG